MKYLKLFLREQKGKMILTLLLLVGQSVGTLLIPYLIAGIVDQGIIKGDMSAIWRIGGTMLLVALLSAAVSIWGSWCSGDIAALFGRDMRRRLVHKSQQLSLHEFDQIGVSSMVTRSTSDISNMQMTFGMTLQLIVPAPMMMAASILMTFQINPWLAGVLIACMAAFLVFAAIMLKASARLARKIQRRMDRINQMVRESITGTRVIRAFGNERYEEERSGKAYADYAGTMIRLNRMFAVVNPAVWIIIGLCVAAIVWLGGQLTAKGGMEIGQITAAIEYSIVTLSYLIMAAVVATTLPKMRSCLDRLQEVLEMEPNIQDASDGALAREEGAPVVVFDRVGFAYPGAEEAVVTEISFACHPGQTTAIIGGTGSGKSTVADLLLRLHDIGTGSIRLYGTDIRALSQLELRAHIGCVPQKSFLFSGTIAENLRMGDENATDEALWEALRVAQAEDFVAKLPLGLQAPVAQGGTNFSGGQRQRLAIARALVRNASIYVFDDSFSALDVKTDASLRAALRLHGVNAAKLIIAQRVSTIMDADQILVLDNGQIAGKGTHAQLMQSCPVYQDIVSSQMEEKEEA